VSPKDSWKIESIAPPKIKRVYFNFSEGMIRSLGDRMLWYISNLGQEKKEFALAIKKDFENCACCVVNIANCFGPLARSEDSLGHTLRATGAVGNVYAAQWDWRAAIDCFEKLKTYCAEPSLNAEYASRADSIYSLGDQMLGLRERLKGCLANDEIADPRKRTEDLDRRRSAIRAQIANIDEEIAVVIRGMFEVILTKNGCDESAVRERTDDDAFVRFILPWFFDKLVTVPNIPPPPDEGGQSSDAAVPAAEPSTAAGNAAKPSAAAGNAAKPSAAAHAAKPSAAAGNAAKPSAATAHAAKPSTADGNADGRSNVAPVGVKSHGGAVPVAPPPPQGDGEQPHDTTEPASRGAATAAANDGQPNEAATPPPSLSQGAGEQASAVDGVPGVALASAEGQPESVDNQSLAPIQDAQQPAASAPAEETADIHEDVVDTTDNVSTVVAEILARSEPVPNQGEGTEGQPVGDRQHGAPLPPPEAPIHMQPQPEIAQHAANVPADGGTSTEPAGMNRPPEAVHTPPAQDVPQDTPQDVLQDAPQDDAPRDAPQDDAPQDAPQPQATDAPADSVMAANPPPADHAPPQAQTEPQAANVLFVDSVVATGQPEAVPPPQGTVGQPHATARNAGRRRHMAPPTLDVAEQPPVIARNAGRMGLAPEDDYQLEGFDEVDYGDRRATGNSALNQSLLGRQARPDPKPGCCGCCDGGSGCCEVA
jgi:hypothetical protein